MEAQYLLLLTESSICQRPAGFTCMNQFPAPSLAFLCWNGRMASTPSTYTHHGVPHNVNQRVPKCGRPSCFSVINAPRFQPPFCGMIKRTFSRQLLVYELYLHQISDIMHKFGALLILCRLRSFQRLLHNGVCEIWPSSPHEIIKIKMYRSPLE